MDFIYNFPLIAALSAIIISQIIKIPVAYLLNRPAKISLVTSTGGMPSSHSAGVTALITGLIIDYGWRSPLVAISIVFGVIVMFDSMGVRRQSGEHGVIINDLIEDFKELRRNMQTSKLSSLKQLENERNQSKEILGHKPIEVFFGILSGILIALIFKIFIYTS